MGGYNNTMLIVIFLSEGIISKIFYNCTFHMYIQILTMYMHYFDLLFFIIICLDLREPEFIYYIL